MTLRIEVDSLAFPGLTEAEAQRAADVFAAELRKLLTEYGPPSPDVIAGLERVDLGQLALTATTPDGMGRDLARRLFDRVLR